MGPIAALTTDLMDRTRLGDSIPGLVLARDVAGCLGADFVLVDLARHAGRVVELRGQAPASVIVGYGPHLDAALLARAIADGADAVIPRSRLFRDPAAAIAEIRADPGSAGGS